MLAAAFDPPPVVARRRGTLLRRDTRRGTEEDVVRRAVLAALRTAGASGVEVTATGVMAVFPSARTALRAAVATRAAAGVAEVDGGPGLRVGLHAVELDGDGDDEELALGRRTAAALAHGAGPGEVLATDVVATLGIVERPALRTRSGRARTRPAARAGPSPARQLTPPPPAPRRRPTGDGHIGVDQGHGPRC